MKNIRLPESASVYLKNCDHIAFENVTQSVNNQKPVYKVTTSTNISY